MNRNRSYKRYMDYVKKTRKLKIAKSIGRKDLCKIPGKLIKGKIHCSCASCTPKTNNKGKTHYGSTKITYATRNWKKSDKVKIDSMNNKLQNFLKKTDFNLKNCTFSGF